jgi:hypothetical protein
MDFRFKEMVERKCLPVGGLEGWIPKIENFRSKRSSEKLGNVAVGCVSES